MRYRLHVADVAEEMMEHYVRHVFVEDDGHRRHRSARDLLGAYASGDFADPDDEPLRRGAGAPPFVASGD